jgi:hypothetical protein
MTMTDNGMGIAPGDIERIFEPFFLRLGAGPYIRKPYTWLKLGQAVKAAIAR